MSDDRPQMEGFEGQSVVRANVPMPQNAPEGSMNQMSVGASVMLQQIRALRNEATIRQKVVEMATRNAGSYLYSWEVKNNRTGKTETIEGGTIKLANDIARLWGNCRIMHRVETYQDHFLITAAFLDLETNFWTERSFKQRRSINIGGKYDDGRKDDMAMQIGVSKAIRNVVLNALSEPAEIAVATVKKNFQEWVSKNPEKVIEFLNEHMERYGLEPARIEKTIGKRIAAWSTADKAVAMMKFRSLDEGAASVDDVFPEAVAISHAAQTGQKDTVAGAGAGAETGKKAEQQQEGGGQKMVEHVDPETGEVTQQAQTTTQEGDQAKGKGSGKKKAAAEAKDGGQAPAAATAADKPPVDTSRSQEPEGGAPAQEQVPQAEVGNLGGSSSPVQQKAQPAPAASNAAPPKVNLFEDGAV